VRPDRRVKLQDCHTKDFWDALMQGGLMKDFILMKILQLALRPLRAMVMKEFELSLTPFFFF